ncbi:MAG: polysaccharide pyruvyl transferase family protein, partial [Lachnospiraceae bacterium]|nr:polysaccharide pyruvyl transferase family protein [Lachnospiraceae bacterium]
MKNTHIKKEHARCDHIIFYMHAGSGNHGCEAIVNSTCKMIEHPVAVVTNSVTEDERYSLKGLCALMQERKFADHRIAHILYYLYRALTGNKESFIDYRYHLVFGKKMSPLAVSIGGDNYCYDIMVNDLMLANRAFHRKGTAT